MSDREDVLRLSEVRAGTEDDLRFIYSTWLKGLYNGNDWFGRIRQERFFKVYHGVIESVLKRPDISVQVACQKADPSVILGYAVTEGPRLHWIYLKADWRGYGLARQLVPADVNVCTHLTRQGITLKPKNWEFDPF